MLPKNHFCDLCYGQCGASSRCDRCLALPKTWQEAISSGIQIEKRIAANPMVTAEQLKCSARTVAGLVVVVKRLQLGYRLATIKGRIDSTAADSLVSSIESSEPGYVNFVVVDAIDGEFDSAWRIKCALQLAQQNGSMCAYHIERARGAGLIACLAPAFRFGARFGTVGDLSQFMTCHEGWRDELNSATGWTFTIEENGTPVPTPPTSDHFLASLIQGKILTMEQAEAAHFIHRITPGVTQSELELRPMVARAGKPGASQ